MYYWCVINLNITQRVKWPLNHCDIRITRYIYSLDWAAIVEAFKRLIEYTMHKAAALRYFGLIGPTRESLYYLIIFPFCPCVYIYFLLYLYFIVLMRYTRFRYAPVLGIIRREASLITNSSLCWVHKFVVKITDFFCKVINRCQRSKL